MDGLLGLFAFVVMPPDRIFGGLGGLADLRTKPGPISALKAF